MDPLLEFPDNYNPPPAVKKKAVSRRTVVCEGQTCELKNKLYTPQIGKGFGVGGLNPQDFPGSLPLGAMKASRKVKRFGKKSGRGKKKNFSGRGKGRRKKSWKKKKGTKRGKVRRRVTRPKRRRPAKRRKRQKGRGKVKRQVGNGSKRKFPLQKKSVAKKTPIRVSAKSIRSCASQKPIKFKK
jgi:hypothetical protein